MIRSLPSEEPAGTLRGRNIKSNIFQIIKAWVLKFEDMLETFDLTRKLCVCGRRKQSSSLSSRRHQGITPSHVSVQPDHPPSRVIHCPRACMYSTLHLSWSDFPVDVSPERGRTSVISPASKNNERIMAFGSNPDSRYVLSLGTPPSAASGCFSRESSAPCLGAIQGRRYRLRGPVTSKILNSIFNSRC